MKFRLKPISDRGVSTPRGTYWI